MDWVVAWGWTEVPWRVDQGEDAIGLGQGVGLSGWMGAVSGDWHGAGRVVGGGWG